MAIRVMNHHSVRAVFVQHARALGLGHATQELDTRLRGYDVVFDGRLSVIAAPRGLKPAARFGITFRIAIESESRLRFCRR